MAVLAASGVFGAISALVTPGDAAGTARDIAASESLFRLGIACSIVVVVLDMIVAAARFAPVNCHQPGRCPQIARHRLSGANSSGIEVVAITSTMERSADPTALARVSCGSAPA